MPRDASGTYTLPTNDSSPAAPRNVIRSSDFNELTSDYATALTDSLSRSGDGAMLADLDMDGHSLLNEPTTMKKADNLSDVADKGTAQDNIQVGAAFASVAVASAATIPARNKRLRTQFNAPSFATPATLVGGANYRRESFASLGSVPTRAYFRSVDRFMPDGSTDNTNGGYWVLNETRISVSMFGAIPGDTAGNLLAAFQAAIDFLPSGGGVIDVPDGSFANLVPGSLTVGNKAITFDCRNRTTTLPANMPGIVLSNGVTSEPETSVQSNRTVRIHNRYELGNALANASTRQYVHHVSGFLPHVAGSPAELEVRAFSFDLGTDHDTIVDSIRGMKGRVYAPAGQSNIRAIYGFAESSSGGTHTGLLTGLLGTVYANGRTSGDMCAVRGHVDGGTLAAFQAAGAKVGETNDPFFGFLIRSGTGGPLLAKTAGFSTHGGGAGVMYQGLRDNVDLTTIFEVGKTGKVLGQSFRSGAVSVADDAVVSITPPSLTEGLFWIDTTSVDQAWATAKIRASGTHLCRAAGTNGTSIALSTTVLTGTTGVDGQVTVSCNNGVVQIENRMGAARQFVYKFMST